jgi:hypothetical protein
MQIGSGAESGAKSNGRAAIDILTTCITDGGLLCGHESDEGVRCRRGMHVHQQYIQTGGLGLGGACGTRDVDTRFTALNAQYGVTGEINTRLATPTYMHAVHPR